MLFYLLVLIIFVDTGWVPKPESFDDRLSVL